MPQLLKTLDGKINGRQVRVKEIIHSGGPFGHRDIYIQWVDEAQEQDGGWPAGTVVCHTVLGDPRRRRSFKILWAGQMPSWF
jgi:hypothetical protein